MKTIFSFLLVLLLSSCDNAISDAAPAVAPTPEAGVSGGLANGNSLSVSGSRDYLTDFLGNRYCVSWDCEPPTDRSRVDHSKIDFLRNFWIAGPNKSIGQLQKEGSGFIDKVLTRLLVFNDENEVACIQIRQSTDESTYETRSTYFIETGKYQVQPGKVDFIGSKSFDYCIAGTTGRIEGRVGLTGWEAKGWFDVCKNRMAMDIAGSRHYGLFCEMDPAGEAALDSLLKISEQQD